MLTKIRDPKKQILSFGISSLIKWFVEQNKTRRGEEKPALEIAKERYAKGEITKEEFEEIKRSLE